MPPRPKKQSGHNPATTCPFKGEPGYVRARLVRDPKMPGWLVLYDRANGCPPGMAAIQWVESTRWVLMWRPLPGQKGRILYRALADSARADEALTWAAKGIDQLGLWEGKPVPASHTHARAAETPDSGRASCAHTETAPKKTPAGVSRSSPTGVPRPPIKLTIEQQWEKAALTHIPTEKVLEELSRIIFRSMMPLTINGNIINDIPHDALRLKAMDLHAKYLVVAAAQREKEKAVEQLDTSHLHNLMAASPEFCAELQAMLDEFKTTRTITTLIPGDPGCKP